MPSLLLAELRQSLEKLTGSPPAVQDTAFTGGYCAEFAVALQLRFGYRLGAFYEYDPAELAEDPEAAGGTLVHAFAWHPTDPARLIDVRGARTVESVLPNLVGTDPANPGEFRTADAGPEDLDAVSCSGLEAPMVAAALARINATMDLYASA